MNLEQFFAWIRLVAQVVLGVLEGPNAPEMKPERIQIWIGIVARAVIYALESVGDPPADGGPIAPEMKPERIQFWLRLISRFVLAIFAGASEETGKSGEWSGTPGSSSREVDW